MKSAQRLFVWLLVSAAYPTIALAGQFSFTGVFSQDNDLQLFGFTIGSATTVTLQTWSYGGGVNAAGQTIAAGGFEPVLGLFDSAGTAVTTPIEPGPGGGTCTPQNPDPARAGFCQDAFAQIFLTAGTYIVSLTQSPNDPLGDLSAGFLYIDAIPDPNFNNGFVGSFGFPGNGNWALDINGVDSAMQAGTVPEPGTMVLGSTAILVALFAKRKRLR